MLFAECTENIIQRDARNHLYKFDNVLQQINSLRIPKFGEPRTALCA